jgi:hypothetical protein
MCVLFDATIADLGVEKGFDFYYTTNAAQKRYARSELEFYVAVNKLVRAVKAAHGQEVAQQVRALCGDSDDYTDVVVREDGDSAAIQRPEQTPFPLIKIDGKWHFSLPDFFDIIGEEMIPGMRLHYESVADAADEIRQKIEKGELKKPDQIVAALTQKLDGEAGGDE